MKPSLARSFENIVVGLSGFSGGLIAGALFAGSAVFHWESPAFQFLVYGAAVSVLYRDIRTYGLKEGYYTRARRMGINFFRATPA